MKDEKRFSDFVYKFCTVWAIYVQNLFEKRQDFMLKILKTKDSVENKEDIKKNLEKLAANNIISNRGNLLTYPIKRVKENTKYIFLVYTLLNEHIKIGIPIHPAGEWLLDNYYIKQIGLYDYSLSYVVENIDYFRNRDGIDYKIMSDAYFNVFPNGKQGVSMSIEEYAEAYVTYTPEELQISSKNLKISNDKTLIKK